MESSEEKDKILFGIALDSSLLNCNCIEATYFDYYERKQIRNYQIQQVISETKLNDMEINFFRLQNNLLVKRDLEVKKYLLETKDRIRELSDGSKKESAKLLAEVKKWKNKIENMERSIEQSEEVIHTPLPTVSATKIGDIGELKQNIDKMRTQIQKRKELVNKMKEELRPGAVFKFGIDDVQKSETKHQKN